MPDAAPPPQATPPEVNDLRARIAGQSVIEQLLARQQRTAATRPFDDHLRSGLDPDAESWYSGALGEIRVGLILATLDSSWTVVHSIPVGERGSDLDHLVVGPAGVYVINTKRHFGKRVWAAGHGLRVDNHQVQHLRNLELEISRTETMLKAASGLAVDAVGIIAIVDAASVTVVAPPEIPHREAHVMDASHLVEFLRARQRVFSDEQTARIVDAAVRAATWTATPASATDGDALRLQFESLRVRVEAGARARPAPLASGRRPRGPADPSQASVPPQRRAPARRVGRGLVGLLLGVGAMAVAWWGFNTALARMTEPPPLFATAAEERAALVTSAGTAARLIDQHSPAGTRPAQLSVTPGTAILQTSEGTPLVDLPDGTLVTYAPSADLLSYSLTLTGPEFGTTVTVSPEAGVVVLNP